MGVLMAGLSPHPPLLIPEIGGADISKIEKTVMSLKELAWEMKAKKPDLLITVSPHGPVFSDAISILDQDPLTGDFNDFGHPEVKIKVATNTNFIRKLQEKARDQGIEVLTLSSVELEYYHISNHLDHGVLVPLYYLKEAGLDVPVIPITMGLLAYQRLYDFGLMIQHVLAELDLNAVIVASGDLSHRLKPGAPAGYNPHGKEFDERLMILLREGKYKEILNLDPQLIEKAGECGLRPLIIVLGALRGLSFKSEVKSYEGPFGVGYGVVSFRPEVNLEDED